MNRLIKFEFRKLFRSSCFIICLVLVLLALVVNAFLTNSTYELLYEASGAAKNGISYVEFLIEIGETPFFITYNFADESMIYLLSGIFIAIFVCSDYSLLTIKNVYSKGYTRRQVMISKYLVSLAGTMIMVVSAYILSLIVGLLSFKTLGTLPKHYLLILLLQILVIIVYHAFFFFISNSLGKSGGAVPLCITIPTAVNWLTTLFDVTQESSFLISDYWISNLSSQVVKSNPTLGNLGFVAIVSLAHIIVWLGLGYLANRKKQF